MARSHGVDVSGARVIDPRKATDLEEKIELLVKLRKHKGMTQGEARGLLLTDFTW